MTTGYDATITVFGIVVQGESQAKIPGLETTGYNAEVLLSGTVFQSSPGSLRTSGYSITTEGEVAKNKLFIKFKDEFGHPRTHEILSLPVVTEVSSDYIVLELSECVFADATAGDVAVYMVTAAGRDGVQYYIGKVDKSANLVTITPLPGETINGAASLALSSTDEVATIIGSNGNWRILNVYSP